MFDIPIAPTNLLLSYLHYFSCHTKRIILLGNWDKELFAVF